MFEIDVIFLWEVTTNNKRLSLLTSFILQTKTQQLAGKVIASVFWDAHGVILIDYLKKGSHIWRRKKWFFMMTVNHLTHCNIARDKVGDCQSLWKRDFNKTRLINAPSWRIHLRVTSSCFRAVHDASVNDES